MRDSPLVTCHTMLEIVRSVRARALEDVDPQDAQRRETLRASDNSKSLPISHPCACSQDLKFMAQRNSHISSEKK